MPSRLVRAIRLALGSGRRSSMPRMTGVGATGSSFTRAVSQPAGAGAGRAGGGHCVVAGQPGSARSTPTSARQSPPSATARATSSRTLPGSCTAPSLPHGVRAPDSARSRPVHRAVCVSSTPPPGTPPRRHRPRFGGTGRNHHYSCSSGKCLVLRDEQDPRQALSSQFRGAFRLLGHLPGNSAVKACRVRVSVSPASAVICGFSRFRGGCHLDRSGSDVISLHAGPRITRQRFRGCRWCATRLQC